MAFFAAVPALAQATGPGGVTGAGLWIKSDDAGAIGTAWKDQSTNNNPVETIGSWSLSTADRAHNFHPYTTGYTATRHFRDDSSFVPSGLTGIDVSIFSAVRRTGAGEGRISGVDSSGDFADQPSLSLTAGGLPRFYKYSSGIDSLNGSTAMTISRTGLPYFISDDLGGTIEVGLDGQAVSKTRNGSQFTDGDNLLVGYGDYSGNTPGAFPGDIMEVVWFLDALTSTERDRVNSYLAVKYGTTLQVDYLNSSGGMVWNRTTNAGYNSNIAGIGRDDDSGLNQKQSNSINSGDQVILTLGSAVAASNAANAGSFTADSSFLVWGDNAGSTSFSKMTKVGSGTWANYFYRMNRTWKFKKSGTVPNTTVFYPFAGTGNINLIVGDSPDFSGNNFQVSMQNSQTIDGTTYRRTSVPVNFGSYQYFTFATSAASPLVVTSTADANVVGTLRGAIEWANDNTAEDEISFNISGAGPHTITLSADIPPLTDDGISIDGTTQSGTSCGQLSTGTPHTLKIYISGDGGLVSDGFALDADDLVLKGLAVGDFGDQAFYDRDGRDNILIECNYWGVDPDGVTARPNANSSEPHAAELNGTSNAQVINNLFAGTEDSDDDDLVIRGSANTVTVTGNLFNLNAAGTAALGTSANGFVVADSTNIKFGGALPWLRNVVGGVSNNAVEFTDSSSIIVLGNYVGVGVDGSTLIPSLDDGIQLDGTTATVIGNGTSAGANIVAGHGDQGMKLIGSAMAAIIGNRIYGNGSLGIDLDDNGITANDSGDGDIGANNLLNFPVINEFAADGTTTVNFDINVDVPSNANGYRIDFFKNTTADASGYGEGEIHLGSVDIAHTGGNLNYVESFTANASVSAGDIISATTTRKTSGVTYDVTSEFSLSVAAVVYVDPLIVTSTADTDTLGTLRYAINHANANTAEDAITFDIPGSASTIHTIALGSALPTIADHGISIDGTTQGDATCGDLWAGTPHTLRIHLDGGGADMIGLEVSDDDVTLKGLSITNLDTASSAIGVQFNSGSSNGVLQCSYVGLAPDGTLAATTGYASVYTRAADTLIGGTGAGDGNVFVDAFNSGALTAVPATATRVIGNFMGTDPTGMSPLGTTARGFGNAAGAATWTEVRRNLMSGMTLGISLEAGDVVSNPSGDVVIAGNYIGVDRTGNTALANSSDGIRFETGTLTGGVTIGGTVPADRNVISGNGNDGIEIGDIDDVAILGNYIGVGADGISEVSNVRSGISSTDTTNLEIGNGTAGGRNVISNNSIDGVELTGTSGATLNGNYIGVASDGLTARGNNRVNILIQQNLTSVVIQNNIIANSKTNDGIELQLGEPTAAIFANSIYGNFEEGIDLDSGVAPGGEGVNVNDAGDVDSGPNDLLNYPVINSFTASGTTAVSYDLDLDVPSHGNGYRIDFFKNTAANASGYGEGEIHLGSVDIAHAGGDLNFPGSFTANTGVSAGDIISATATRKTSGVTYDITSEFSAVQSATSPFSPITPDWTDWTSATSGSVCSGTITVTATSGGTTGFTDADDTFDNGDDIDGVIFSPEGVIDSVNVSGVAAGSVTFSSPVQNPILHFYQLDKNDLTFALGAGQSMVLASSNNGQASATQGPCGVSLSGNVLSGCELDPPDQNTSTASPKDPDAQVGPGELEAAGTLRFTGTFSSISFTSNGSIPSDNTTRWAVGVDQPATCSAVDRSDAPADGTTAPDGSSLTAYGQATHAIASGVQLGDAIDADGVSITSVDASGDGADDDGVVMPFTLVQGTAETIAVEVSGTGGYLNGWIDWNGDGTFGAGEQVATDLQDDGTGLDRSASDGWIKVVVTAPASSTTAQTFARWRWSTQSGLGADGAASDGEVEDYAMTILSGPPAPYAPALPSDICEISAYGWLDNHRVNIAGAEKSPPFDIVIGGWYWDSNGRPQRDATDAPDQTLTYSYQASLPELDNSSSSILGQNEAWFIIERIEGPAGAAGQIATFDDSNVVEHNVITIEDSAGNVLAGYPSPFTSVRLSVDTALTYTFPADGVAYAKMKFADYQQFHSSPYSDTCASRDFSDAPASYGEPFHLIRSGIQLGAGITSEGSGYAAANADADANDDGVTLPASFEPGTVVTLPVAVSGSGFLNAWIDWNGNGSFDDIEHIANDVSDYGTGTINLSVSVPEGAIVGQTFARFRWSGDFAIGSDGSAYNGEVEDYQITIADTSPMLSGTVFVDNGVGGGTAHDGLINGSELGVALASIMILDGVGTQIATTTLNADGTWQAMLPVGFSGSVQLVSTALPGYRFISEDVSSLPGVSNAATTDGTYTFNASAGVAYSGMNIGVIALPSLSQNRTASISAGQIVDLEHVYAATTTGTVSFALTDQIANPADGFESAVFEDLNCDGAPDQILTGNKAVAADTQICLVVRTQAGGGISDSASYAYGITATTSFTGTAVSDIVRNDDVFGAGGGGELVLKKLVTNMTKAPTIESVSNTGDIGDILQYRIVISNSSSGVASDLKVNDATPAYTALSAPLPMSVTVVTGVTCALQLPAGANNNTGYSGPIEWNCPGSFPPGAEGSLTFNVQISP